MLTGLICLTIMIIVSTVLGKRIARCDYRCLYLNKKDLYRFRYKEKLVETTKEYFVL